MLWKPRFVRFTMPSNYTPEYASVARGLWLVALLITCGTALRLWPAGGVFTFEDTPPCLSFVEWRVGLEAPELRCLHEALAIEGCQATALDVVLIHKDGGCTIDPGAMSGRLRLAAGLPLDINRATAADFALLSGIGSSRAEAIVHSRIEEGKFENIEALQRVPGIGERTIAILSPFIEVAQPPAE